MINSDYLIDYNDWTDEGGYCQVYPIKHRNGWVFKEFKNKKKAKEAYRYQRLLTKHDLAPKVYTKVCKLKFDDYNGTSSNWGYITELATIYDPNTKISMKDIQNLVENINEKTGLKFWDCHWYNVGTVKRGRKKQVVCIDTGKESFNGLSNAWGFSDPGPKCGYCSRYQCKCSSGV